MATLRGYYTRLQQLPRQVRRSLQRRMRPAHRAFVQPLHPTRRQSLGGLALLLALGVMPAHAATITVDGATCTLVDAITAANTDLATGGCLTGSGADTIVLPASSTQTLTAVNNTTFGATGLPVIASDITLQGNGSTISRTAGSPNFRIMAVNSSGNLTLQTTTISGGLIDATMFDLDDGGGIANYGGTVTLTGATVTGNSAASAGGGVYNQSGTMTLTNATVSGNSAARNGGGVFNFGTMTLTHATVSGNSAARNGGGVFNFGTMTLTHATVSGNSASNYGGVVNFRTLTLSRTLISGNTGGASPEVSNVGGGTINANDFNLFGANGSAGTNFTPGATDIVPGAGVMVANILAPLALNPPGTTRTHALVTGSPAIDAVTTGCPPPATDQRGVSRPQDGDNDTVAVCDIGAFELEVPLQVDLAVTKDDSGSDPVLVGANLTYTLTVSNPGSGGATGVLLTDTLPGGVTFVSATPSQGSCGGAVAGAVSCTLGAIASGGSATVSLVVTPTQSGTLTNSVDVSATETETNTGNNSDTEDTTVNPVPALTCNGLAPTQVGTEGNNVLRGTTGDDVILGLGGNDVITGNNGNDTICGGNGRDVLSGGNGIDRLLGEADNDALAGGNDTDTLDGGTGNDALAGNNGNDALDGGANTDACSGGSGTDTAVNCEAVGSVP